MIYRLKEFIFKNKTTRQTIVKNVFWLGVGQFGSRFIRAAITIYAARVLGASEYGVFSYALGASSFFMIFSDIGISSILNREVSKKPEEGEKYFATIFIIKLVLLAFTSGLIIFMAPMAIKIEKAALLLPFVALLTIFDGLRELANSFFNGKEKMELGAYITLVANIGVTLFGFIGLYLAPTSLMLLQIYTAGSFFGFLTTIYFLKKEYAGIIKNFSKKLIWPIIEAAWPMAAGGIVGSFMFNVDILMMGWWRTSAEIGFYSAAQKIVGILYILGGLLATAVSPAFFRIIHEGDKEKISIATAKIMLIVLLVALPMSVGGIILSEQIINLIFGNSYSGSIPVFMVLISSLLIIYPFSILNNIVFAYNKQAKMLGYAVIATLANVVLNSFLIPKFGGVGAAIATVFANGLNVFFLWKMVKNLNGFKIFPDLQKIIIAVFIMAASAILLRFIGAAVIINVAISSIVYFYLLYILKDKNFKELLSLIKI